MIEAQRRCIMKKIFGQRSVGRPNKRWLEEVEKNTGENEITN